MRWSTSPRLTLELALVRATIPEADPSPSGLLSRLVNYRLGRVLVLGQTHGRPFRISPGYARQTIRAMGTCRSVLDWMGSKQGPPNVLP